jgi:hypothetical protein
MRLDNRISSRKTACATKQSPGGVESRVIASRAIPATAMT